MHKNRSDFPGEELENILRNIRKKRSEFPEKEHPKLCCAISARTNLIFQEGFFKFSQGRLRFSRRTYP